MARPRATRKPLRRRDFLRRVRHVLPQVFPDRAERLMLEVHMLTAGMQLEQCSLCSMPAYGRYDVSLICAPCIRWCAARVDEFAQNGAPLNTDTAMADIARGLRAAGGEQSEKLIAYLESQAASLRRIDRGRCLFCGLDSERRSSSTWGAKIPTGAVCGDCVRNIAKMDPADIPLALRPVR